MIAPLNAYFTTVMVVQKRYRWRYIAVTMAQSWGSPQ